MIVAYPKEKIYVTFSLKSLLIQLKQFNSLSFKMNFISMPFKTSTYEISFTYIHYFFILFYCL